MKNLIKDVFFSLSLQQILKNTIEMADLSVTLSEIEVKIRKLIALKNQLEEENSTEVLRLLEF